MNKQTLPEGYFASASRRLMSCIYDGMLLLAIAVFVGAMMVIIGSYALTLPVDTPAAILPDWYRYFFVFPAMVLAAWGYYLVCWKKVGQTLGMQTLYLKTVDANGKHLSYREGFKRCVCASLLPAVCAMCAGFLYGSAAAVSVSLLLGLLMNYVFIWVNPHGLALHDYLSKTLTVRIDPPQHESFFKRFKKPSQG